MFSFSSFIYHQLCVWPVILVTYRLVDYHYEQFIYVYICSNIFIAVCILINTFMIYDYDAFHILYIRSREINTLIDWLIYIYIYICMNVCMCFYFKFIYFQHAPLHLVTLHAYIKLYDIYTVYIILWNSLHTVYVLIVHSPSIEFSKFKSCFKY